MRALALDWLLLRLRSAVFRDLSLFVFSTVAQKFAAVAAQIIVANLLGASNFGVFVLIFSGLVALDVLATAGFGSAAMRYVAESTARSRHEALPVVRICVTFVLVASSMAIALLGAVWVFLGEAYGPGAAGNVPAAVMLSAAFPSAVGAVFHGALVGAGRMGLNALALLTNGACHFAFPVAGALLFGIDGAMVGWGLASWFALMGILVLSFRHFRMSDWRQRAPSHMAKRVLTFAFGAGLAGIVPIAMLLGNWILVISTGSTRELGYYQVLYQWFGMLLFVPNMVGQAIVPRAMLLESEAPGSANALVTTTAKYGVSSLIVAGLLVMAALPLLRKIYASEYHDALQLLPLFLCAAVVVAPQSVAWSFFLIEEKMLHSFFINLIWAVIFLTLALVLVGNAGGAAALGAALLGSYAMRGLGLAFWLGTRFPPK